MPPSSTAATIQQLHGVSAGARLAHPLGQAGGLLCGLQAGQSQDSSTLTTQVRYLA